MHIRTLLLGSTAYASLIAVDHVVHDGTIGYDDLPLGFVYTAPDLGGAGSSSSTRIHEDPIDRPVGEKQFDTDKADPLIDDISRSRFTGHMTGGAETASAMAEKNHESFGGHPDLDLWAGPGDNAA